MQVTIQCNECGSNDVTKAGLHWRRISKNPPVRIRIQAYRCKQCGKLFMPLLPAGKREVKP